MFPAMAARVGATTWAVTKAGSRRRRGYNVDSSWTEVALFRWFVPTDDPRRSRGVNATRPAEIAPRDRPAD